MLSQFLGIRNRRRIAFFFLLRKSHTISLSLSLFPCICSFAFSILKLYLFKISDGIVSKNEMEDLTSKAQRKVEARISNSKEEVQTSLSTLIDLLRVITKRFNFLLPFFSLLFFLFSNSKFLLSHQNVSNIINDS